MGTHSDDEVGQGHEPDGAKLTDEQRRILGSGGEAGRPEPKRKGDWAERGVAGGEPGRSPPVRGGSSQGTGDRTSSHPDKSSDHSDRATGAHPQPAPGEG